MDGAGIHGYQERECDHVAALAALHALISRDVAVSIDRPGGAATILLRGELVRGYELGRLERAPVIFEIGEQMLAVWPERIVRAWRRDYRSLDGTPRLGVEIELADGNWLDVVEDPRDQDEDPPPPVWPRP